MHGARHCMQAIRIGATCAWDRGTGTVLVRFYLALKVVPDFFTKEVPKWLTFAPRCGSIRRFPCEARVGEGEPAALPPAFAAPQ